MPFFETDEYLLYLLGLPILIALYMGLFYLKQKALKKFGTHSLIAQLMPTYSARRHHLKFGLIIIALGLLIISLANPQWGKRPQKVTRKSVDVILAIDVSESMLAQDIAPNRMERTKLFALRLLEQLKGDRVGIVIFAGNAYLQMPLTTDYGAAALFIKNANPDKAPSQGTAISEAVELSMRAFEENNKQHKALVLMTDGENHEAEAIAAVQNARDNGMLLFTVGIGTAEGGYIPTNNRGQSAYKTDASGNPVRTRLNEEMLRELSSAGGGAYFNLSAGDKIVSSLKRRIDKIEKSDLETTEFSEKESYFQYVLILALILLILEFMISYRKGNRANRVDIFEI